MLSLNLHHPQLGELRTHRHQARKEISGTGIYVAYFSQAPTRFFFFRGGGTSIVDSSESWPMLTKQLQKSVLTVGEVDMVLLPLDRFLPPLLFSPQEGGYFSKSDGLDVVPFLFDAIGGLDICTATHVAPTTLCHQRVY